MFLSPLNSPFHNGSTHSWGLAEDLILGLQKVATPRPPEPEGSSALAVRPSWDLQSQPFQSRHLQSLQKASGHGSADLLNLALATTSLLRVWSCMWDVLRPRHQPLNGSSPRHSSCPQVPLRLVYGPHANPASCSRVWLWKE